MCGIIGYVGDRQATPLLSEGLQKLEYRGYDSAGICTVNSSRVVIEKDIGKLEEIQKKIDFSKRKLYEYPTGKESSFHKNFQRTSGVNMKIFNFIKNEAYYAVVDKNTQNLLSKGVQESKIKTARKLGISYQTLQRILNDRNYWANLKTLQKLFKMCKLKESILFQSVKRIKTKNSFPFNIQKFHLSPELMRILGHLIGDGGIHLIKKEQKYRAFYVNNERVLLNSFSEDIKVLFGNATMYSRQRVDHGDEIWLPTSIGRILYSILEYQKNNDSKRVPSLVYRSNKKFLCFFLQALYDDEGFIYPQKNMIVISQSKKILLEDIRKLVSNIGIKPNRILVHHPKNRTKMYYFTITHKNNILKFDDKVGFLHPEKKNKLKLLVKKYG